MKSEFQRATFGQRTDFRAQNGPRTQMYTILGNLSHAATKCKIFDIEIKSKGNDTNRHFAGKGRTENPKITK